MELETFSTSCTYVHDADRKEESAASKEEKHGIVNMKKSIEMQVAQEG